MFGFFNNRKKHEFNDIVKDLAAYHETSTLLAKANNLKKLGRHKEWAETLLQAEKVVLKAIEESPDSLKANLLLV